MSLPNFLAMAGDIQALPTVVTGGGDFLVFRVLFRSRWDSNFRAIWKRDIPNCSARWRLCNEVVGFALRHFRFKLRAKMCDGFRFFCEKI